MILDKDKEERLDKYRSGNLSFNEKVPKFIEDLGNKLDPLPYLNNLTRELEQEEHVLRATYENICTDIKEEVFKNLMDREAKKSEVLEIETKLLNKRCLIYSKLPPLQEHKDSEDYELFLNSYKRTSELNSEISGINAKINSLLGVQEILDHKFAEEIIELQYLLNRVIELSKISGFAKTPQMIENYKKKYGALKELNQMISLEDSKFEKLLEKLRNKRVEE